MSADYDEIVKSIISEWRKTAPREFPFQTRALERHVLPIIYYSIRKEILKEKIIVTEKDFKKKFNQLSKSLLHIYWIILWSFKWFLFFRPNGKKFLVCAVGSDRKLTFAYLDNLLRYSGEKNLQLLTLNVVCNKSFLFHREIFYFPRFLFQFKFNKLIKIVSKNWQSGISLLENIIQKHIRITMNFDSTKRFINDYARDYYCVKYFLERFGENIVTLIQDFDYTSNRNIYTELFKSRHKATVSLNHSVLIYNHIYESVYSDYAFVWGQHQKKRIEDISELKPKKISVIGTPIMFDRKNKTKGDKNYWIYNVSSFENPATETIHRSVDRTLEMIEFLNKIILEDNLSVQLLVNYHPNDSVKAIERFGFKGKSLSFSEIHNQTELVFCEDSTITIEMLKTEIPIIYITDKVRRDPFNFLLRNTAELVFSKEDLRSAIQNSLAKKLDLNKREEHFDYYLGDSENFYENLKHELDVIIE